ncbi:MAG TPA: hypothetical protein VHP33_00780 [Polyangiaceae bacterium]|nr:hypothetical protein [Polyangiaceae bacterium]
MWLIDEQRKANQSTRSLFDSYLEHRTQTTQLALDSARPGVSQTLCVLGAGNCLDLDLTKLAARFSAVHLVDIDRSALEGAVARQTPDVQARLVLHAPVDLSGLLDKLERWARLDTTEQELLQHHRKTSESLAARIGSHDVVLSASCITQMQLSVLQALGDKHQLFDATRHVLGATHLHTLHALTKPGGRALLVTDVLSSTRFAPLAELPPDTNLLKLLTQLMSAEQMIYIARPGLFHMLQQQDPLLNQSSTLSAPLTAWVWQNGPHERFLVYAMALDRKA